MNNHLFKKGSGLIVLILVLGLLFLGCDIAGPKVLDDTIQQLEVKSFEINMEEFEQVKVEDKRDIYNVLVGFTQAPGEAEKNLVRNLGGEVKRTFTIVDAMEINLPGEAISALAGKGVVRYVEPNAEMRALEQDVPWGIDRVFGDESHLFDTWGITRGNGIAVAILDTGIDENHEDLPKLSGGVNTIDDTHWGSDGSGHGTHVAGTVAALDNEVGVVGVGPKIGLYAVKVLSDGGSGSVASVVAGIEWAVGEDIPILNMSLGGSSSSTTLKDACDAAYEDGHLLVASAGNSGNPAGRGDNVGYPAAYESVIAVAASTDNDRRASFSSTGSAVELIAPGSSILSTLPGDNYGTYSGTSMASPHVAGVAGLVKAFDSGLSNADIRQILQDTAEDLGLSSNHQGFGLARADLAVRAAEELKPPATGNIEGIVKDEANAAIEGATVVVEGTDLSAATDADGYYLLENVPAGDQEVTASADGYYSETATVTVEEDATFTQDFTLKEVIIEGVVRVESITYTTRGGRLNDRHLDITLLLLDDQNNPVADASVSATVERSEQDEVESWSFQGTTGSDGTVIFTLNNHVSGCYETEVTAVKAEGLEWDGVTPENKHCKE